MENVELGEASSASSMSEILEQRVGRPPEMCTIR